MTWTGDQRLNVGAGSVLLLLGIVVAAASLEFGLQDQFGPGPGFLTLFVGAGLVAGGAALAHSGSSRSEAGQDDPLPNRKGLAAVASTVAALIVAALAFDVLGFPLTVFLLSFFAVTVLSRQSVLAGLGVSISLAALSYLAFAVALQVRLPTGPLPLP